MDFNAWSMLARYLRSEQADADVLDRVVRKTWDAAEDGAALLDVFGIRATAYHLAALNREIRGALASDIVRISTGEIVRAARMPRNSKTAA